MRYIIDRITRTVTNCLVLIWFGFGFETQKEENMAYEDAIAGLSKLLR